MKQFYTLLLAMSFYTTVLAQAQWSPFPSVNKSISSASGLQENSIGVSDGAGGAFVAWEDSRDGNTDVYVQRVDADGNDLFALNGMAVCNNASPQTQVRIVADGSGGAIIAWVDYRNGNADIYAQRIDASGSATWTANGKAVVSATGNQLNPAMAADGSGGVMITWQDARSGNNDIYAQHIDGSGTMSFAANGMAVNSNTGSQINPQVIALSGTEFGISWEDYRNGNDVDLYAQKLNTAGTKMWTATGAALAATSGNQYRHRITKDGSGGLIAAWQDDAAGLNKVKLQRMGSAGATMWNPAGVSPTNASAQQNNPRIVSDELGGAIVIWGDDRNSDADIYGQRINASGVLQWFNAGVPVVSTSTDQLNFDVIADGDNGIIVSWEDYRSGSGTTDLYAQRLDRFGISQWIPNGTIVSSAFNNQYLPKIILSAVKCAIVVWNDYRFGFNANIFAAKLNEFGGLPVELMTFEGRPARQMVQLYWETATEANSDRFVVERSKDGVDFERIGEVAAAGTSIIAHQYEYWDQDPLSGINYYRLRMMDLDGEYQFSEVIAVIYERPEEIVVFPNPASSDLHIKLPHTTTRAEVTIFNNVGHTVHQSTLSDTSLGIIDVRDLPEGNYLLVVRQGVKRDVQRFTKVGY